MIMLSVNRVLLLLFNWMPATSFSCFITLAKACTPGPSFIPLTNIVLIAYYTPPMI